jgi:hypothetical protein
MSMKRVMSVSVAAILCASQVSALSCVRPDAAREFQWASEAEENYVVLLGAFSFDAPQQDPKADPNNRQSISVPAQFDGSYLGANGFVDSPALDVTLNFDCLASWCGSLPPEEEFLAFVQETPDGYVLGIGPCFSNVFGDPRNGPMQQVESCMRGEGCEEASDTF